LLEEFFEAVLHGNIPVLPVGPGYDFATSWLSVTTGPTLIRRGLHLYHKPSFCPHGRGLVWQPFNATLDLPVLTPLPPFFIEQFVRERVLDARLPPELVAHVMGFLDSSAIVDIRTTPKPYTFYSFEDANAYFDRHGIKSKTDREIGQDLDRAVAGFESVFRYQEVMYEPEVVDESEDEESENEESENDESW